MNHVCYSGAMQSFTPFTSLAGGLLIGAAVSALWLLGGRLAGISGIMAGLLTPRRGEIAWRALFVAGLVAGGLGVALVAPGAFAFSIDRSAGALVVAGLLVGVGTRLGSGCTSGHGVCGIGRLSPRSMVATLVFMGVGAGTVFVVEHVLGGAL